MTLTEPINGWWDGGEKRVFRWRIDGTPKSDTKGLYARVVGEIDK